MFENIINFFKNLNKKEKNTVKSKETAKDRLHLVLVQDRANVSADFLDLMRKEIIDVIKKYIEIDDKEIDVQLTNMQKEDGTVGAPVLHANIPIVKIKNEAKKSRDIVCGNTSDDNMTVPENDKNEQANNSSSTICGNTGEEDTTVPKNEKKDQEKNSSGTVPDKEQEKNKPESNLADDLLKEVAEIIKSEENKKNS